MQQYRHILLYPTIVYMHMSYCWYLCHKSGQIKSTDTDCRWCNKDGQHYKQCNSDLFWVEIHISIAYLLCWSAITFDWFNAMDRPWCEVIESDEWMNMIHFQLQLYLSCHRNYEKSIFHALLILFGINDQSEKKKTQ